MDEGSGIIHKKSYTPASVHDSQKTNELISGDKKSLFADKAYTSDEQKREMRQQGIYCGILDKNRRNLPMPNRQKGLNRKRAQSAMLLNGPLPTLNIFAGIADLVMSELAGMISFLPFMHDSQYPAGNNAFCSKKYPEYIG